MVQLTRQGGEEIPFRDTGIRGFARDPVNRSGQVFGEAISTAITGLAPAIENFNRRRFLSNVTSALDETELTAGAIEAVGSDAQTELGPKDKNIINQLHREKSRIDLQVEQGVLRDRDVRGSRLAVAQSAIQANPHLAPEINELFKIRFGRGIGEEGLALREESLAAATAEKAQFEEGIRVTSKTFDIPTSLPLDQQLELQRPFVEAQMRLNLTKQQGDQASAEEKLDKIGNDKRIAKDLPDLITVVGGSVRGIVAGIDPTTSSDDEKRDAVLQLQNLRLSILLDAQGRYGQTHSFDELASKGQSVLDLIDNRISWVNGESDSALGENTEAVIRGRADNK